MVSRPNCPPPHDDFSYTQILQLLQWELQRLYYQTQCLILLQAKRHQKNDGGRTSWRLLETLTKEEFTCCYYYWVSSGWPELVYVWVCNFSAACCGERRAYTGCFLIFWVYLLIWVKIINNDPVGISQSFYYYRVFGHLYVEVCEILGTVSGLTINKVTVRHCSSSVHDGQ